MSTPDVFLHDDPVEFLKHWYEHQKEQRGAAFSYEWIARQIDVRRTSLHAVFAGKRPLSVTIAAKLCNLFNFDEEAAEYFLLLVLLQSQRPTEAEPDAAAPPTTEHPLEAAALAREREAEERDRQRAVEAEANHRRRSLERVRALQWRRRAATLAEAAELHLSHWLDVVLKDLARRPDFTPDPAWIGPLLCQPVEPTEIRDSLRRLVALGVLQRDPTGRLHPVDVELRIPLTTHRRAAMRRHHLTMLSQAATAIETLPTAQRLVMSGTLLLPPEAIDDLKEQVRQFMEAAMAQGVEQATEDCEVVQLNVQLFPWTRAAKG